MCIPSTTWLDWHHLTIMGLLPNTQNCRLHMSREYRERFPRHQFQRKPLVSDPGMHHGTCFTHVPWCMSGSLTCGDGESVSGIPGACETRHFAYLVRGPFRRRNDIFSHWSIQLQWPFSMVSYRYQILYMPPQLSCCAMWKFHGDNFTTIWMRKEWNLNQIWITIKQIVREVGPWFRKCVIIAYSHNIRQDWIVKPLRAKTELFRFIIVNIVIAEALATQGAR